MIDGSNLKKNLKKVEKEKNPTKTSYSCIALYKVLGWNTPLQLSKEEAYNCSISENIQNALLRKKKASSSWLASEILSMVNCQKVKLQQEGLPNLRSSNGFNLEG